MIEWFQLIVAMLGFFLGTWRLWIIGNTAIEMTDAPAEDPKRLIAKILLRSQMARTGAQLFLTLIGFASVLLPTPLDSDGMMTQSALTRLFLVLLTVLLTLDAILEQQQRREYDVKVQKYLARDEKQCRNVSILMDNKTIARGSMLVDPQTVSEPPHTSRLSEILGD